MTSSKDTSPLTVASLLLVGILVTFGTATIVQADDLYWDTNGSVSGAGDTTAPSGPWNSTATNWSSAAAGDAATQLWTPGQTAVFSAGTNATGTYTITITGTQSVGGLRFEDGRSTITGGVLSMGNATIANAGAPQVYILSPIQGSGLLTLTGANQTFLNGVVSDNGGTRSLLMQSGQWVFGGDHTYSGGTTINSGEAAITRSSSGPAGAPTGGPFGKGIVEFNGGIMRPSSGSSQTIGNAVILGGNVGLGMTLYSTSLTFSGPLTLTGHRVLTVSNQTNSGVFTFSGSLGESGGSFGFTKAGNAVLSLNANNTFTGGVIIDSGTLRLGHAGALNATTPNAVTFGSNSTGILDLNGQSVTVAGLSTQATLPGSPVVENNSSTPVTLTVSNTTDNTFAGVLRDGGTGKLGLTKASSGLLVLAGANTYSGNTTITGGVLRADDGVGLPSGIGRGNLALSGGVFETGADFVRDLGSEANQVQLTGGTSGFSAFGAPATVALGGTASPTDLTWGNAFFNPTILVLNDATANAALEVKNAIDLNGTDRTIAVRASTATLSGLVSNSSGTGLTKSGAGTLVLANAANSFAGDVAIDAGAVSIAEVSSLGSGANLALGSDSASGSLQFTGSTGQLSRNIAIGAGGAGVDVFDAMGSLTLSGPVTGSGPLTKSGSGLLTLTNTANDFGGPVAIDAGTLSVADVSNAGVASALGTGNRIAIGGATNSGTLQFTGTNDATNRSVTLGSAGGAIDVSSSANSNLTLNGPISGGALTKAGLGILTLSVANDYSGVTNVDAGVLNVRHANALGTIAGGTVVVNNARVELQGGVTVSGESIAVVGNGGNYFGALQNASGDNVWEGAVILNAGDTRIGANAGTLTIRGEIRNGTYNQLRIRNNVGTTILAGENTYTGGTDVLVGTLKIAEGDNRLPVTTTLSLGINGPTSGLAGTFDLNGRNQTVRSLVLAGLTDSAVTNTGATASTFTVNNPTDATYGGRFTNGTNPLNLVKSGTGVFSLTNTNATAYNYTGTTEITAGILALAAGVTLPNSSMIRLTSSAAVLDITSGGLSLASGQTLAGIGTVRGSLTVSDGSTLSPGLSPGTLTTGSETWAGGGNYLWEIDDAAGTAGADAGWDLLSIDGSLTLTATVNNRFALDLVSLVHATHAPGDMANFDNSADYVWTIAQYSGSFSMTGADDFASRFNLINHLTNDPGEGVFSLVHDATHQQINLVFTSGSSALVPEPATLVLLGLGLGAILAQRRLQTSGLRM